MARKINSVSIAKWINHLIYLLKNVFCGCRHHHYLPHTSIWKIKEKWKKKINKQCRLVCSVLACCCYLWTQLRAQKYKSFPCPPPAEKKTDELSWIIHFEIISVFQLLGLANSFHFFSSFPSSLSHYILNICFSAALSTTKPTECVCVWACAQMGCV